MPATSSELFTFQHFRVIRRDDGSPFELGRGAMGTTYKAQDAELGGFVALKVINPGLLDSEVAQERFLREARAAAYLHHPNVASVFHLGKEGGNYFYAMEFVDGESLEGYIRQRGTLPVRLALRIALQTAHGLAAANERGLVHRDIKPANLMLLRRDHARTLVDAPPDDSGYDDNDDLVVKVIDFGLAKSLLKEDANGLSLTGGGPIGTPYYMSPEQIDPSVGDIDARSDIYSLGVTLWHLLSGKPPFHGSQFQVLSQHLNNPPPVEALQQAGLPAEVVDLLNRMLAKQPDDRPANHRELIASIKTVLRALPLNFAQGGAALPLAAMGGGATVAGTAASASAAASAGRSAGVSAGSAGTQAPASNAASATDVSASTAGRNARKRKLRAMKLLTVAAVVTLAEIVAGLWWYHNHYLPEKQRQQALTSAQQEEEEERAITEQMAEGKSARTLEVPGQYVTIQAAIDAARAGDTVQVAAGERTEQIKFKEGIRLLGAGMDKTTVRDSANSGSVLLVENCGFGTISGFCFEQTPGDAAKAQLPAVTIKNSSVQLLHCRVRNAGAYGIYIRNKGSSLVEGCEVTGAKLDGIHSMDPGTTPTIKDNHSYGNQGNGIFFHFSATGLVEGNLTENNDGSGIALLGDGVTPRITRNKSVGNKKWGIYQDKASAPVIAPDNNIGSNGLGLVFKDTR